VEPATIQSGATSILALLIALWGFSIMLRPLTTGVRGARMPGSSGRHSSGFMGRLFLGILFSVVLPVVWWTIALAGRAYQRTFVVFTEFLTGVHDWNTYRTSSFKYGGAAFAFLGFNIALWLLLNGILQGTSLALETQLGLVSMVGVAVLCCVIARMLMRRMP